MTLWGEAGRLLGPTARGDSWRGPTSRSRLLNLFRGCSIGWFLRRFCCERQGERWQVAQTTGQDIGAISDGSSIDSRRPASGGRRWLPMAAAPGDSGGYMVTAKRVTGVTVTECEQDRGDGSAGCWRSWSWRSWIYARGTRYTSTSRGPERFACWSRSARVRSASQLRATLRSGARQRSAG